MAPDLQRCRAFLVATAAMEADGERPFGREPFNRCDVHDGDIGRIGLTIGSGKRRAKTRDNVARTCRHLGAVTAFSNLSVQVRTMSVTAASSVARGISGVSPPERPMM